MRKWRVFPILVLLLTVFAPAASADQPVTNQFSLTGTGDITDLCVFPVHLDAASAVTETAFFDKNGALTRVHDHAVETDIYTANGKTLVSDVYTYNADWEFDSAGNLVHLWVSGVALKAKLPDGGQFTAAGRSDFMAHPGVQFIFVPDKGNANNLPGFCAALAP